MAFSRMIAAAALLAALVVPATAGARATGNAKGTPARTTLSAATSAGQHYWGVLPCNGKVKVLAQQRLAAGLSPTTDAWVTFGSALGANNLAAPASTYTNCTISLGRSRWPTAQSMQADWDVLCMTMVHELGHLLGHPHDATPGSVMAPVFTDLSSEPAICRTTRPARASAR